MIILIDERLFLGDYNPGINNAIECAIASARLSQHRILVSPKAIEAAERLEEPPELLPALRVLQASWVEGQAMARLASRILVLISDPALSGRQEGNQYFVDVGDAEAQGIFREPSIVLESMETDAKLLRIYMLTFLDLNEREMMKYWDARLEQGGGSTIFNFVKRHAEHPHPIVLISDRDCDDGVRRHSTADKCVRTLTKYNIFPSREAAIIGGFSPNAPHIAFRIHLARAIENLVFPPLMEVFLDHVATGDGEDRRAFLLEKFPNFPNLDEAEAKAWLFMEFKDNAEFGSDIFNSSRIDRLLRWRSRNEENKAIFSDALRASLLVEHFEAALRHVLREAWTIGQRLKIL